MTGSTLIILSSCRSAAIGPFSVPGSLVLLIFYISWCFLLLCSVSRVSGVLQGLFCAGVLSSRKGE